MTKTPEIQAAIDNFVDQLTKSIQQHTLSTLKDTLGSAFGRNGQPARVAKSQTSSARTVRPMGAKRSPEELERLTAELGKYVKAHPGQRIEQVALAMRIPSKELALPVRKLIAERVLKTKGQKRATTYFPT